MSSAYRLFLSSVRIVDPCSEGVRILMLPGVLQLGHIVEEIGGIPDACP